MSSTIEATITCPNCKTEIPLTETLAAPFIRQAELGFQEQLKAADEAKRKAEEQLSAERAKLEADRASLDAVVTKKVQARLTEAEKLQREAIREELAVEIKGANDRTAEVTDRLKKLQTDLEESLKAKQRAELAADAAKIEAQKQAEADLNKFKADAVKEAQEAERLKLLEKDQQIQKLVAQLDEAKRQAQQGSQQAQGEVMEIDFEDSLRQTFPWDTIEPVKQGQRGGDVLQHIMSAPGVQAGTILWEVKRTQNWSNDWPGKAKQDAINAKADVVLIMSDAVPKGVDLFGFVEGVWVCKPHVALMLAQAMRQQIDQLSAMRRAVTGKQGKAELLYDYLIGPEFRSRLEGIVEPFVQMQRDLDSEKRATMTRWKKREKQMDRVLQSATGMVGDLQGLVGRDIPELPAFTDDTDESESGAIE